MGSLPQPQGESSAQAVSTFMPKASAPRGMLQAIPYFIHT